MVDVLEFEFLGIDDMIYEERSQFGNVGFYHKGEDYKLSDSVYDRKIHMPNMCVYGGSTSSVASFFDYGMADIPKNMHDLPALVSRTAWLQRTSVVRCPSQWCHLSSGLPTNQLTHLKIQQAIAKAKPDGLIIDIEGLENVQLGKGGDLQPLEIQDIYEQTGVFYYRSKNPEGGFQNPPVRPLDNTIRNINELIGLYNHYLRMIRDVTGVNEVLDGSSPKSDALVGVRQQQLAAGNNAINDITNAASVMYRRVCEDIVKCVQVLPVDSIIYQAYERAIGKRAWRFCLRLLSSHCTTTVSLWTVRCPTRTSCFSNKTFSSHLHKERLTWRTLWQYVASRIWTKQSVSSSSEGRPHQHAAATTAADANAKPAEHAVQQAAAQMRMQQIQMKAQADMQKIQAQGQIEMQLLQMRQQMESQMARMQMQGQMSERDKQFRMELENSKDNRKDSRVEKQATASQAHLPASGHKL